MWHTSRGDRTLNGHEAALVSSAVEIMVSALLMHIDEDFEESAPDCESGITIYDVCTPSQRIGLLHDVAKHLLTDTDAPIPLSALIDATVAAIFVEIRDQIAIEIELASSDDMTGQRIWRQLVLDAHASQYPQPTDEDFGLSAEEIQASSLDLRRWEFMINELSDMILWDRDFEMADGFLDVDPGVSQQRRRLLGIEDEYFTAVAPDPRPDEAYKLASKTRDIVRGRPR